MFFEKSATSLQLFVSYARPTVEIYRKQKLNKETRDRTYKHQQDLQQRGSSPCTQRRKFPYQTRRIRSIMGTSGSGESPLPNIPGILDNYDTGDYRPNNVLVKNLNETKAAEYRNRMIGFIFQSLLINNQTDNIRTIG